MNGLQVKKDHYFKTYDNKGRFNSYWHQIEEIVKLESKNILEIGIGNSLVRDYLKRSRLNIITVDIDLDLKPDIVSSILHLPAKNKSFDAIVCYQVLEHLPFENFSFALKELHRVAKKYVLISLPNRMRYFSIDIKLYPVFQKTLCFTIPYLYIPEHKFDGQHYWEIGKKNISVKKIKAIFKKSSLRLENDYRVPEKPLHHFFILKKSSDENLKG